MAQKRASLKEKMRPGVLLEKTELADPEVALFRIAPKDGELFDFASGQYVTIGLDVDDEFVPRAYSIASSPLQRDALELYINIVEQGHLTPALFALELGDEVYYMGPKGIFTLKRSQSEHLFFLATGTGLAPFVSMLRTLHIEQERGHPHGRSITLAHGVRVSSDLGYREELQRLAGDEAFGFMYLPMVSRPQSDPNWTPELGRGRVTELLSGLGEGLDASVLPDGIDPRDVLSRLPPNGTAVYLCGNPDMINDSKRIMGEKGYGEIYTEEYW